MRTEHKILGYVLVVPFGTQGFEIRWNGEVHPTLSAARAELEKARVCYPATFITELMGDVPVDPDFERDTEALRKWLGGGSVVTKALQDELALWNEHFK